MSSSPSTLAPSETDSDIETFYSDLYTSVCNLAQDPSKISEALHIAFWILHQPDVSHYTRALTSLFISQYGDLKDLNLVQYVLDCLAELDDCRSEGHEEEAVRLVMEKAERRLGQIQSRLIADINADMKRLEVEERRSRPMGNLSRVL